MYCVLFEEWNPPEYIIHASGTTFNPTRGKHELKSAESHRCEGNTLCKLSCNLNTFFKGFSKGTFFRKSLTESEGSDRF